MAQKAADAFRTISEVADWLGVSTHVLRFWEGKFPQIKPVKRAGGRRYYRPSDMELLGGIKVLLHEDGLTVKGVQKVLREQGVKSVAARSRPVDPPEGASEERPGGAIFSAPVPTSRARTGETLPQKAPERLPLFSERRLPSRIDMAAPDPAPTGSAPEEESAPLETEPATVAGDESMAAALQGDMADTPDGDMAAPDEDVAARDDDMAAIPDEDGAAREGSPLVQPEVADDGHLAPAEAPRTADPMASADDPQAAPADEETWSLHTDVGAASLPVEDEIPEEPEPTDIAPIAPEPEPLSVSDPSLPGDPDRAAPPHDALAPGGAEAERAEDVKEAMPGGDDDRPAPTIAPLPDPDQTLAERISRLMPGQIPAERLRPLHARLAALRARMDGAGNGPENGR